MQFAGVPLLLRLTEGLNRRMLEKRKGSASFLDSRGENVDNIQADNRIRRERVRSFASGPDSEGHWHNGRRHCCVCLRLPVTAGGRREARMTPRVQAFSVATFFKIEQDLHFPDF